MALPTSGTVLPIESSDILNTLQRNTKYSPAAKTLKSQLYINLLQCHLPSLCYFWMFSYLAFPLLFQNPHSAEAEDSP